MTIVNHDTGEIVDTIGADEARRLTTEAQNEFRSSREHFDRAWSLIEQAVEGGGHVDLGYRSPGDYLHSEFDGVLSGLDVSSRRIAVRTMTEWGLSTRAIAQPLGVNQATVVRDLSRDAAASPQTPAAPEGEAGPQETVPETQGHGPGTAPAEDPSPASPDCDRPEPTPILGRDGKTYQRPTPKPDLKPVVNEDEWSEQDRAEELSANLARNLSLLYAVTVAERRAEFIANWHRGVDRRPVLGQNFVTPTHMRRLADALQAFATEWEQANV